MERPRHVHWDMASVGIAFVLAALLTSGISAVWKIAGYGLGGLLVLLAMGWPQRLAESVVRAFDEHIRRTHREHDAATANQLLRNAADGLSALPTRETGDVGGGGLWAAVLRGKPRSEAVVLYREQDQAATVYAVKAALSAGARDGGALQLAQGARCNSDLLELKAELLRMVVELTPSLR